MLSHLVALIAVLFGLHMMALGALVSDTDWIVQGCFWIVCGFIGARVVQWFERAYGRRTTIPNNPLARFSKNFYVKTGLNLPQIFAAYVGLLGLTIVFGLGAPTEQKQEMFYWLKEVAIHIGFCLSQLGRLAIDLF